MSIRESLLALLAEGPTHGFALKKAFEARTGGMWPLNVGQVYTTLGRLVRDGAVAELPGSDDGQKRYEITDAGRAELADWYATPRERAVPDRDDVVIKVVMALADPAVDTLSVIDEQRQVTMAALQQLTRRKARLAPDDLGARMAHDAAAAAIEAELRWLDHCEEIVLARRGGEEGTS